MQTNFWVSLALTIVPNKYRPNLGGYGIEASHTPAGSEPEAETVFRERTDGLHHLGPIQQKGIESRDRKPS